MKFTKYGRDVLSAVVIIALVLFGLAVWTDVLWLSIILVAVGGFLSIFSLNFFRDPDREIDARGRNVDNLVVSPADGLIVGISEVEEPEYLKSRATLISIFMSPLDVHVNRAPINGAVEYYKYIKGEFLVAHAPESTHKNERAVIGMKNAASNADGNGGKILFAQVAGYIARRIVCNAKIGDKLAAGERFGMIKFGSRVDIWVPLSANILVKNGERTVAGETVLAEFTPV